MNKILEHHLRSVDPYQRSHSDYWNALVNAATEFCLNNGIDIDPIDATIQFFIKQ